MLSQKEAVYQATQAILEHKHIDFQDGEDIKDVLGDDMEARRQIRDLVLEALNSGQVAIGESKSEDPRSMRAYATGLISNWFRKDRRFNGNQRYTPHATRHESGLSKYIDERIARFKSAQDVAESSELKGLLQEAIHDREDEIAMEKDLAEQVKQGKYFNEFEDEQLEGDNALSFRTDSSSRIVDQDAPPSMGSGHRGAVTDPSTDRRLQKNEDEQQHQAHVEAGKKGGATTAHERGPEFYSEIGQKGGLSRGSKREQQTTKQENNINIFREMLRKKFST
jgi:general stress protein YciG